MEENMALTFVLTSQRTFNDGVEPVCFVGHREIIEVKAKIAQFVFHIESNEYNPKGMHA
jgi:hypothetical protein